MPRKTKTFKVGDLVTIARIPPGLKDPARLKTRSLFQSSLGKTYRVEDTDLYGHLQLNVTPSDTIWIEPRFAIPAKKKRGKK